MKKNKTTIQRNWQHRGYTRWRKTKRQSRGNIGGTHDEEKQNDNPETRTPYVASGLSFCFSSSCVPPMLPLDCRFVFLHLVYPLCCQFLVHKMKKNKTTIQRNWQHRGYTRWRKTKRQSRGNIGGTQDEENQNDNPEKLATQFLWIVNFWLLYPFGILVYSHLSSPAWKACVDYNIQYIAVIL
jgi:hypothetical protein